MPKPLRTRVRDALRCAHGAVSRIDELVMVRVEDKGGFNVHQDANWNVVALTDLGGSVVERYVYTPYGEITVHQETSFGDRDGDGDVDSQVDRAPRRAGSPAALLDSRSTDGSAP